MKNSIADVRNHLVAQLEALGDPEADAATVAKAKAAADVSNAYVATVKVEIQARELLSGEELPAPLEGTPALPERTS